MRTISRYSALLLCAAIPLMPELLKAQSVAISPGYTTIGVNQTVQYTAMTTGLSPETVTWKVHGVTGGNATFGTITAGGLYTAPAAVPSDSITVSALGSDQKTYEIVYVNVAPAGPSITNVSPNPIPTGNFTVTLTGTGFKPGAMVRLGGVNLTTTYVSSTTLKTGYWQGSVTPAAVFQVMNPGTLWGPAVTVPFVQSGPPGPQAISPTAVNVNLGATQQFTSANASSWAATAGTVDANGLYTAPATMPASNKVNVTATGPGGNATAVVTLINPNAPTIAPATVTLSLGATQQFTSAGATSWAATYGAVTPGGLYTAPAAFPASGTDTVTATGPNGSAAATVTLTPPAPVITGVSGNAQLPLGVFGITINGTGFIAKSTGTLGTSTLHITSVSPDGMTITATGFASTSGIVNLIVSNGAQASQPFQVQVGVPNAVVSAAAARRFLEQAAFGPTPAAAAHVQTIGFQAWINEQLAMPVISNFNTVVGSQGGMPNAFLTNAVTNPDQLRQRVAFALSEIFVTSITKLIWNGDMVPYQQMLINDAFTNYRKILGDVTLSPGMGEYLDMANNAKANPAAGTAANENYAREVMQLFSMGDVLLNQDGTVQIDSVTNLPVPAYLQPNVSELARVFTGWTYAPKAGGQPFWGAYINSSGPMVPIASMHDFGSKNLLSGYTAAANLTPQQDLQAALDNIASHPNVAPFISKQLIQHLVKSNPTPAYVQRVAQAFTQSNGDMPTVVTTILLDPEARANDEGGNDLSTDGHLQEPALFIPGFVRALAGQMTTANYYASDLAAMGEDLYNPASVFNYFSPGYTVAGTGGLKGPEFQINNPNSAILRENLVATFFAQYSNPVQSNGPGTIVDLTPFLPLASTPSTLMDALDLTLTHGTMPALMKTTIQNAVTLDHNGNLHRTETAVYLILMSSYYNVWH